MYPAVRNRSKPRQLGFVLRDNAVQRRKLGLELLSKELRIKINPQSRANSDFAEGNRAAVIDNRAIFADISSIVLKTAR